MSDGDYNWFEPLRGGGGGRGLTLRILLAFRGIYNGEEFEILTPKINFKLT